MRTSISLKKLSMAAIGATLIALGIGKAAQATVLTFEDLPPISNYAPIPNSYGGFNWDNFSYRNGSDPAISRTGYDTGRVSGNNVAYNSSGNPAIVNDGVFNFNSAYLTAAWNDGLSVTVEGLRNGSLLYSKNVVVDTKKPTLVNFDYLDVDAVRFTSSGGTEPDYLINKGGDVQFALDNFTFNETPKSVPEPTLVLALLSVSTVGVGSMLKRKQQQKNIIKA